MTIIWPWNNDKSTADQRFGQLAYDVVRLHNALAVATQRIEALEQQAAQQGQAQSDIKCTLTEVAGVLNRWEGE